MNNEKDNEDVLDEVLNDEGEYEIELELEPEENPYIDDFTPNKPNEIAPVTSIKISEEDRLKIIVAQLQLQTYELENKIIEQKYARKTDELNHMIEEYKQRYSVPDEWTLHGPTGTFNKK